MATTTLSPTLTTASGVTACPSDRQICLNGGQCLVLNGKDFICSGPSSYTGIRTTEVNLK